MFFAYGEKRYSPGCAPGILALRFRSLVRGAGRAIALTLTQGLPRAVSRGGLWPPLIAPATNYNKGGEPPP